MELDQRLSIKDFEGRVIPGATATIVKKIGTEPIWRVEWDSFNENPEAFNHLERWGIHRIRDVLLRIAADPDGREFLCDSLIEIRLKNVPIEQKRIDFDGGCLTVHASWHLGGEAGFPGESDLVLALGI